MPSVLVLQVSGHLALSRMTSPTTGDIFWHGTVGDGRGGWETVENNIKSRKPRRMAEDGLYQFFAKMYGASSREDEIPSTLIFDAYSLGNF